MAKIRVGQKVKVSGEHGEGSGVVVGRDKRSGHAIVRFDHVEAQDTEGRPVKQENVMGYAPIENLRRG